MLIPHTLAAWIECLIIVGGTYIALLWYTQRYGTRLLTGICVYSVCAVIINACSFSLLQHLLVPLALAGFVYFTLVQYHPRTLQKNTIIPASEQTWSGTCLKTILNHAQIQTSVTFVIEYTKPIAEHLHVAIPFKIPWNTELFNTILYDPHITHGMVWLTGNGTIMGIHAQWTTRNLTHASGLDLHISYTEITDALVCIVDHASRSCTLIYQGIVHSKKTVTETVQYITMLTHQTYAKDRSHVTHQKTDAQEHNNP